MQKRGIAVHLSMALALASPKVTMDRISFSFSICLLLSHFHRKVVALAKVTVLDPAGGWHINLGVRVVLALPQFPIHHWPYCSTGILILELVLTPIFRGTGK